MKRIVFFGGASLLAVNWINIIYKQWDVYLLLNKRVITFLEPVHIIQLKEPKEKFLLEVLEKINPDVLVNCAAITNVEQCEEDSDLANNVNALWPEKLAKITNKLNIKFIHISSDHLFGGNDKYVEEYFVPNPLNIYAQTKNNAEQLVLKINTSALIIRTNFYGWGTKYRKSFSDFIIDSLRNKEPIELFSDVYYTPIIIDELVSWIHKAIDNKLLGIYHIVSSERVSKHEFGLTIAKTFELPQHLIKAVSIQSKKSLTLRPLDMSLSNKKIQKELGQSIMPLNQQIRQLKKNELNRINL